MSETFRLDDITWNDLNLDEVCSRLDTASSSVGSEYLRELLRTCELSEDRLLKRDELCRFFSEKKHLKKQIGKIFTGLGRIKKVSFRDYIFKLDELENESSAKHYVLALLMLISIATVFIKPVFGVIMLVAMFIINIATYFSAKAKIENYFLCIKYLVRMVVCADRLRKLPLSGTVLEEYSDRLSVLSGIFSPVKRGSWLITNSVSGSLTDVFMDYIRMLFHVDIIKFNSMKKIVLSNKESVEELYCILGELEACICISDFRENSRAWCVPDFSGSCISFENITHPLITDDAVANSLDLQGSILITGSNASGKSTFLKSTALNQIFAQTIYTCLAGSFHTKFYKVVTSMALNDNILNNESYFIVEIKSIKRIFDQLGDIPVICFIDEVLRGTNTTERIAASSVILKHLSGENAVVFAATHDIELTGLLKNHMENYHFSESVQAGDVHFDFKIKQGPSDSRNAIKLLEVFGFDRDIVDEARSLAETKTLKTCLGGDRNV